MSPLSLYCFLNAKHYQEALWSVYFQDILKETIFLPCSSRQEGSQGAMWPCQWHQSAFDSKSSRFLHVCGCRIMLVNSPKFQVFPLLTWTGLGSTNGMRASMVTTQGEMVVPKLLLRNGPRGTYSHFWMSRARKEKLKAMPFNTVIVVSFHTGWRHRSLHSYWTSCMDLEMSPPPISRHCAQTLI